MDEAEARRQYHCKPSTVYKYLPPEGIVALNSRSLKATKPADFSDINDSFHVLSEGITDGINILGSPFYFIRFDPLTHLPSPISRDELRDWASLSVNTYPGMIVEAVVEIPPMSDESAHHYKEGFNSGLQKLEDRFVLSLTERADSVTMWDYYAKGHQGFVLGFSCDAAFLRNKENSALRRVMYTDQISTGPWEVAI